MQIDTQQITFTLADGTTKNVVFGVTFTSIPSVSAIPQGNNINLFISNLTMSGCTLNSSVPFVGTVSLIAARG